jgi:hypothetical protein
MEKDIDAVSYFDVIVDVLALFAFLSSFVCVCSSANNSIMIINNFIESE